MNQTIDKLETDFQKLRIIADILKGKDIIAVDIRAHNLSFKSELLHAFLRQNVNYELIGYNVRKIDKLSFYKIMIRKEEENIKDCELKIKHLQREIPYHIKYIEDYKHKLEQLNPLN